MIAALAVAAACALLLFLHHAFWMRWLAAPVRDDGAIAATTGDGWCIALGRRRPRAPPRRPPVLLCHGLSANRWMLDAPLEGHSLAAFLAEAGFECFALDLRGHGGSRRRPAGAPRHWSFDTYLREDVPAALDAVREAIGEERVIWVGHSLGALLGMAACQTHPDRIAGLVAVAGPTGFDNPELRRYIRWGLIAGGRMNRLLAAMVAPLAGLVRLRLAEIAVASQNMERPVYRRLMANAIDDVPPGVFGQLRGWVHEDVLRSADGAVDYLAGLALCRQPALFVSATLDGLAPPQVVRAGYQRWGGEKALWNAGRADGLATDYGHTDLLVGRRAAAEVFPRLRDWLLAHSEPAA